MTKQNSEMAMDQKIFELGLPVVTVSVYLMCTGLADLGEVLSMDKLKSMWSGDDGDLTDGIETLKEHGIIAISDDPVPCCRLLPSDSWKKT